MKPSSPSNIITPPSSEKIHELQAEIVVIKDKIYCLKMYHVQGVSQGDMRSKATREAALSELNTTLKVKENGLEILKKIEAANATLLKSITPTEKISPKDTQESMPSKYDIVSG